MTEEETIELKRLHTQFLSNAPLSPADQTRYDALLARIDAIDEQINATIFQSLQSRTAQIEILEAANERLRANCIRQLQ